MLCSQVIDIMQSKHAALQYFILIFNGLHAIALSRHNSLVGLSKLKRHPKSLVILVSDSDDYDIESNYDQRRERGVQNYYDEPRDTTNNDLAKDPYESVLYDILRVGKVTTGNRKERIIEESLLEYALRSRCQAKVKCEEKCSRSEERRPKKERYCQKSCKAVFDYLLKCPPSGNRKEEKRKENRNHCRPAIGKTCPPAW